MREILTPFDKAIFRLNAASFQLNLREDLWAQFTKIESQFRSQYFLTKVVPHHLQIFINYSQDKGRNQN